MRLLRLALFAVPAAALPLFAACGSTDPAASVPAGTGGVGSGGALSKGGSAGSSTAGAAGTFAGGAAGAASGGAAGTTGDMTGFGGSSIVKGGAGGASAGSSGASAGSSGASAGWSGASASGGSSSGAAGVSGSAGSSSGLSGFAGAGGSSSGLSGSGGGAGASGTGAGGTAAGGAAGTGASAGAAGTGVSGGGGAAATGCGEGATACEAGAYCDEDTKTCRSCGDLGKLRFGTPVSRLAPTAGRTDLAFPRASVRDGQAVLSFRARQTETAQDDIFVAALGIDGAPGATVSLQCCVNKGVDDSGALLLPPTITGATLGAVSNHADITSDAVPYFLVDSRRQFDRSAAGAGKNPPSDGGPLRRRFHVAQWDPNPNGLTFMGYGPVPLLNTGLDDFSVAFAHAAAPGAQRFYWMSTRGTPETTSLRTVRLGQTGADSTAVVVTLAGCVSPVVSPDLRPWLTPDGSKLIFQARCEGEANRLWFTQPNADGTLPPAAPLPIAGDPAPSGDTDGSLSPNKCELWFVRGGVIRSATRRLSCNSFVFIAWVRLGIQIGPQERLSPATICVGFGRRRLAAAPRFHQIARARARSRIGSRLAK